MSLLNVILEFLQRHVVSRPLSCPLEIGLEILRDKLLDVQLISGQAVCNIHCSFGQTTALGCLLLVVVLLRNRIIGQLNYVSICHLDI